MLTPIFGGARLDKSSRSQRGKTGNNFESRRYNCTIEQEKRPTVQTAGDATVGHNAATGSTVAKHSDYGPDDATVFDNTVPKNISKELSTASQPESTEPIKSNMKVLGSVMMQQNMGRCKKGAMVLLEKKVF